MASFMPNMSCGPCLYCNATSQDAPEELLRCDLCRRSAHVLCLRSGTPDGVLLGDNFFNFTCSMCHQSGQDTTVRARLNIPQILLLVLYNLHKTETNTARSGFFHWKIHIYNFISHHWKEIFGPESRKKKKKVLQASLSGQLNNYGKYFISGYETLRDGGWYRLAFVLPPAQLIQRQVAEKRVVASVGNADPVRSRRRKISKDDLSKETPHIKEEPIEESVSSGDVSFDSPDDSSRGSWFTEKDVLKPHACPPQALFDSEEEDEKHVTMKEEVMVKKEEADIKFVGVKEDKRDGVGKEDEGDAEFLDVDGSESEVPQNNRVERQPSIEPRSCAQASLFTRTISTAASMLMEHSALSRELTTENVRALSGYEEQQLLHQLEELQESGPLPPDLHRLRRKLAVRKAKREHGLPILNLDLEMNFMCSHGRLMTRRERLLCKMMRDSSDTTARILDRFQVCDGDQLQKKDETSSFLVKLIGTPSGMPSFIYSPYTRRKLKPFIMRDYTSTPLKLKLLQEIMSYPHRNEPDWCPPPRDPIDYCYVVPNHIPAMNQLARHFFWPGIDLSEVLQYPDHTCVVLYHNLVVGFGVLVPDIDYNLAYLSFLLVHPEWRRAGIATFVLYHLIQTCMGKDVTLHVSATNPALILYQRFGFKVEEFLTNFYDKYLPVDSPECKHAMYLRLSR